MEAKANDALSSLPLKGTRVLDLTRALAGPFCTMILADFGADVIKVEPLDGDMIRAWGPFDRGTSAYYLSANRNKRDLAVDFRHPDGLALLRRIAGEVDVVVENFRAGAAAEMGLSWEALAPKNPRLVHVGITGFGSSGPASQWPGFDQIAQGYSGLMSLTGTAESGPTRVGVAIGDQAAGMWAALGTLAALNERHATGRGRKVETSLLASLVGLLSVQGQRYLSLGEEPGLAGNTHPVISPYGVFQTGDGPLNIAPATDAMWQRLCRLLGNAALIDDPRFIDNAARVANRLQLKQILEARLAERTRAEWTELFLDEGIPAGPINKLADVFADSQVAHCKLVERIEHPELGALDMVGSAVTFHPPRPTVRRPPPLLGEHTIDILREFGLCQAEVGDLLARGVVRAAMQREPVES